MVAPLIGLALGLGGFGLQKAQQGRAAKAERASDLGVLASIMQGTQGDTLGGFSPQQQQQVNIVGQSDASEAITLARSFQAGNAQAAQQQFANETTTTQLQNQMQSNKLAQNRFALDLETFNFNKQQGAQTLADNQAILAGDSELGARKAAEKLQNGTGNGSYPVLDPVRGTYGQAWIAGTPQFQAAEGALVGTTQMLDDITELRQQLRTVDVSGDPASLNTRRVQSLTSSLQLQFKNLAELGIISETDFEQFILKLVPDATTLKEAMLSNPQAVDQALVQFTVDAQRASQGAMRNVAGWEGITPEQKQAAGAANLKAQSQNQVAARELQAEQEETRRAQIIQDQTAVGSTNLDEQLLANSQFLRLLTGDTGQAAERLERARALGADPGLVPEGVLGQLGAGLIDNAGKAAAVVGSLLGGRFIAGGARSQ